MLCILTIETNTTVATIPNMQLPQILQLPQQLQLPKLLQLPQLQQLFQLCIKYHIPKKSLIFSIVLQTSNINL